MPRYPLKQVLTSHLRLPFTFSPHKIEVISPTLYLGNQLFTYSDDNTLKRRYASSILHDDTSPETVILTRVFRLLLTRSLLAPEELRWDAWFSCIRRSQPTLHVFDIHSCTSGWYCTIWRVTESENHEPHFLIPASCKDVPNIATSRRVEFKYSFSRLRKSHPCTALDRPRDSCRLTLPDVQRVSTWWCQGCQPYTPAAFTPREDPWFSFLLEVESNPGPWSGRKYEVNKKSQSPPRESNPRPSALINFREKLLKNEQNAKQYFLLLQWDQDFRSCEIWRSAVWYIVFTFRSNLLLSSSGWKIDVVCSFET